MDVRAVPRCDEKYRRDVIGEEACLRSPILAPRAYFGAPVFFGMHEGATFLGSALAVYSRTLHGDAQEALRAWRCAEAAARFVLHLQPWGSSLSRCAAW